MDKGRSGETVTIEDIPCSHVNAEVLFLVQVVLREYLQPIPASLKSALISKFFTKGKCATAPNLLARRY